jgi:hypothetical protein
VYQVLAAAAVTAWSKVPLVVPSALKSNVAMPPALALRQTTNMITLLTVSGPGMLSTCHQPESSRSPWGPAPLVELIFVVELNTLEAVPDHPVPP